MRDYLEGFASETGVRAHVRFGVRVERITPIGPAGRDGWRVETSDGESSASTPACSSATGTCGTRTCRRTRASSRAGRSTRAPTARSTTSRARACSRSARATRAATSPSTSPTRGWSRRSRSGAARCSSRRPSSAGRGRRSAGWRSCRCGSTSGSPARCPTSSSARRGPTAASRTRRRATSTSCRRSSTTCCPYWIQHGRIDVGPRHRAPRRADRALRRRDEPRVRHDPVGDRVQGHAAVPRSQPRARARRRAAAHGGPDAARRAPRTCTSSGSRRRAGRSCRSTPRRPSWSRGCSACDPARRSALAAHFAEIDVPDARIDIVRALWNRQLRDAHKALDRAARPARVAL